jgi:magnesium transporter
VPIVDNAIYVNGRRSPAQPELERTAETVEEQHGFAWIGLYRPTGEELRAIADEFGMHPLAVEDAALGHQRPKLERYGTDLFVVLRSARYLDESETVEFGELSVFVGDEAIVTVRHAESPDLSLTRKRLEADPELLATGPRAVLYALLDQVVDEYVPVVQGLENDIDEIEEQLFGNDRAVSRRIYALIGEVLEFQRAVRPLGEVLDVLGRIVGDDPDLELRRNLRDVKDHVLKIAETSETLRVQLQNALTVNSTLVAQEQNDEVRHMTETSLKQNEDVKKISGWAAILFAPSLVGTVYGMNFVHMPELQWSLGYPFALLLMVLLGIGLFVFFKVRGWM